MLFSRLHGLSDAFYSGSFCFADLGSLIYKHAIPTHHESTSGMLAQFHINVRASESRRPTCIGLSMKNVLQQKYFFRKMFNTTKGVKLGVAREREGGVGNMNMTNDIPNIKHWPS